MINYLPTIYPDELVYSWFSRYFIHSGCFTNNMALSDLLQKRCHNPSKEFIGHLNKNAVKKIEEIISMDRLVLEHTMYPQYARFIPLEEKKKAIYHLGYDFCDPHFLFAILPRTQNDLNLKYCPLCVQEDRQRYGETYWHRKHQIRNMKICYKHKCMLVSSDISAKSEQCYSLSSAEEYVRDIKPVMADNQIQRFSEYMATVFDSDIDFKKDVPISAVLHYGLVGTKYLSKTCTTKYTKKLTEDLQTFYSKMGLSEIATMSQIQRLWFGKRFDFSVICQIAYFIGMSAEDLTKPTLSAEQIEKERKTHYMIDKQPIKWDELDNEIAPKLETFAQAVYNGTASDIGRPERLSEKVVYRQFQLEEHRLENMPKCRAVFDKYSETYEENWCRRLIWAYHKLKAETNIYYWSDISKISGVQKKNIDKVIPYLHKHTDTITANTIIKMIN